MLGREVFLPLDLLLGTALHNCSTMTPPVWVIELMRALEEAHRIARANLNAAQRRQKQAYDVRLREFNLSSGDLVYKVDDSTRVGINKKLTPPWKGPFLVVATNAPLFRIRDRKGDSWQHQDKLKPCRDRAVPLWVRRERSKFFSELDPMPTPVLAPDIQEREPLEREPPEDSDKRWRPGKTRAVDPSQTFLIYSLLVVSSILWICTSSNVLLLVLTRLIMK
jgi:hypothetical protein